MKGSWTRRAKHGGLWRAIAKHRILGGVVLVAAAAGITGIATTAGAASRDSSKDEASPPTTAPVQPPRQTGGVEQGPQIDWNMAAETGVVPPGVAPSDNPVVALGEANRVQPNNDQTLSRDEALSELQATREHRREAGQAPVADQLHQLQSEGPVDATMLHVVSTFETPLPYQMYLRHPELLPPSTERVTFYMELDNGYPLSSVGVPDTDFLASFKAMYADPKGVEALGGGKFPADAADRAVLLGFTTSYETYARADQSMRHQYGIAAAEVVASPDDPPIGWSEPVSPDAVAHFAEGWNSLEGGGG